MNRLAGTMLASALVAGLSLAPLPLIAAETAVDRAAEQPSELWPDIRDSLYGDQEVLDGSAMISLKTPYRAEDAAIVPVEIVIDPGLERRVVGMTVVIDENPAPVAAEFEIGPAMGRVITLSARMRVNAYSNVRVIAMLDDGSLHQYARFVKASGGCSAPAGKDMDAALASLGQIRLRQFAASAVTEGDADRRPEAQVMVRHPNNSGLQMDQVTRLMVPAYFVHELEVMEGPDLVFRMTGGISISEDPTLRFRYVDNGAGELTVRALDTDGGDFTRRFELETGS